MIEPNTILAACIQFLESIQADYIVKRLKELSSLQEEIKEQKKRNDKSEYGDVNITFCCLIYAAIFKMIQYSFLDNYNNEYLFADSCGGVSYSDQERRGKSLSFLQFIIDENAKLFIYDKDSGLCLHEIDDTNVHLLYSFLIDENTSKSSKELVKSKSENVFYFIEDYFEEFIEILPCFESIMHLFYPNKY